MWFQKSDSGLIRFNTYWNEHNITSNITKQNNGKILNYSRWAEACFSKLDYRTNSN